jgi:methionine sulfoxide reductase heme-binding subunit
MTIWFTARAAGLSALVLLSIATAIGALISGRSGAGRTPSAPSARGAERRVILQYLHRVTASLGIGVLALHIVTILADSFAGVGVLGAIVPFTSGYRATWVGLGTIAAYCFVLVSALGFARGRLARTPRGAAIWRGLHASAYAGWALAVAHGFTAGSDSGVGWVRALYVGCIALVVTSGAVRIAVDARPNPLLRRATTAPLPTTAAPLATASPITAPLATAPITTGASR